MQQYCTLSHGFDAFAHRSWHRDYAFPVNRVNSSYIVELWDASTDRSESFRSDKLGNWVVKKKYKDNTFKEFKYSPPPEGYLRKLFTDGTIKSIKYERTGKYYSIIMTLVDLNAKWNEDIKKDKSLMAGALDLEKPKVEQWIPYKYAYIYYPDSEFLLDRKNHLWT